MPEARPGAAPRLVLASGSPRRLALLRQLGFEPEVRTACIDETPRADEPAEALVERLARAKAHAGLGTLTGDDAPGAGSGRLVVVGADTVVVHGERILGKPVDRDAFVANLLALSDGWHRVVTGVAVLHRRAVAAPRAAAGSPPAGASAPGRIIETMRTVTTRVRFGALDRSSALAYWASGEPVDKAGGYALQGLGARFVERIEGSPSNVVGLPLHELSRLLDAAGVRASYPSRSGD